jgi:hypothetical protein
VTSARGLEIGQTLQARWHDGQAEVQVRRLPAATPAPTSTPLRPEGDADD